MILNEKVELKRIGDDVDGRENKLLIGKMGWHYIKGADKFEQLIDHVKEDNEDFFVDISNNLNRDLLEVGIALESVNNYELETDDNTFSDNNLIEDILYNDIDNSICNIISKHFNNFYYDEYHDFWTNK